MIPLKDDIRAAYDKHYLSQQKLEETISNLIPTGSLIQYTQGEALILAFVLAVYGERLKVRGYCSQKEYFISAPRVFSR